jgi:adenylyltransferase/sulfurtransferase
VENFVDKRYVRNYCVEGVDFSGQEKISKTTALVFGIGGLGSNLCYHLAALGLKKLILVDDDIVSLSNLQRQIIYKESSISKSKVAEAKKELLKFNSKIEIKTISTKDIKKVLSENNPDIIFDCTDNYESRLLINKISKKANIPVCSSSAVEWEGWVCMFDHKNENFSFPKVFEEKNNYKNCDDQGVLSPVTGMVASMQALEGIRFILDLNYAKDTLLIVNAYLNSIKKIVFKDNS